MGTTVKAYRALKQQNVAGQVRHYGDFLPEATEWPNLAVWLRAGFVEETFIDSDELEAAIAIQRANDGVDELVENADDTLPDSESSDDTEEADEATEESSDQPKKALKIKKGKNNG